MAGLPLDTIQKYDQLPENGTAVVMVGDPDTLWEDGRDDTYTDQYGTGFNTAWGQPYARVPGLTMSAADAAQVSEVVVRMRVRVREGHTPDGPILLPYLATDPLYLGGSGLKLFARDYFVNGADVTPLQRYNADWQWVDVPMVALDSSNNAAPVQPFLTDPRDKFVLFYISTAWEDQHFHIAEVEILAGVPVEVVTIRRTFPRDDGLAGGAPRTFPPSRAIQSSNRIGGGYL